MNKSFLNYSKTILEKVSFDHEILTKEYLKALNFLSSSEITELENWAKEVGLYQKLNLSKTNSNIMNSSKYRNVA